MGKFENFDIDNEIMENLKTDEDIKEWLSLSLEDYMNDGDLNSFVNIGTFMY